MLRVIRELTVKQNEEPVGKTRDTYSSSKRTDIVWEIIVL